MTPQTALDELLARLAASRGEAVYVADNELVGWPPDVVANLKAARLFVRASPAASAVCPGCEHACAMAVEVLPDAGHGAAAFIVCDKRADINRVAVPITALERWKASGELLADCLARLLNMESRHRGGDAEGRWSVGMLDGRKRKERLFLHAGESVLKLSVAGHALAVEGVLGFNKQGIWLDREALRRCVDQPTGTVAAQSESADERRKRLRALVEEARTRNPLKFLQTVADQEGISVDALKQVIYRKEKAASAVTRMANALARPISTKTRNQR